jgi:hypothetical protein
MAQSTFIDITGQTFNELTAIRCIDSKKRLWEWQCSCGKICTARKNDVTLGKKKSCGHLVTKGNKPIQKGDVFGEWTVIEPKGRITLCRCSCGREREVTSHDLRKGNTKSCGHLTKGTSANGRKDLTGQKIGEWSIGEYLGDGLYKCTCSCGTIKNLKGTYLRTGQSKSCGCITNKFQDLTGKHFGEWTALEYMGDYMWKCQCSCGTIKNVASYELTHSNSTNCGHKRTADILGKRFTRLVTKRYIGDNLWECQCDCGNIVNVLTNNLVHGSTKSCGCLKDVKKQQLTSDIKKTIYDYILSNGQSPFAEDVATALDITTATVHKYVNENNLQDCLNKHFGSKAERDIYNICKKSECSVISRDKSILNGKELDIYLPDKKLAIEFNGNYWHCDDKLPKDYHQHKTIECAKKNIRLLHIFEYEWGDKEVQSKLIKLIQTIVNDTRKSIGARETEIKEITQAESDNFLDKYHLQGKAQATIHLGCFYNNELIGAMTLGSPRFNNNYQYEIVRFCWRDDTKVSGGAEKLFHYFVTKYKPQSIITYTDISKFTGNVYTRLGFKLIQPDFITEPNYKWASAANDLVLSRYETQKHKLIKMGLGTEDQTETEIMKSNNFLRVYDCGNMRLEWKSTDT